ncbi:NLR family, CARD domain containing 5 isoform X2 [Boleophthalmus pectinirostris]|uniref:NLR family, CARD domain containing 5 isoform X2 n=1 Tax=Boleophthalmus pectinirostris TaxID=150288 RepID=UPI00242AC33E|nr:NLR family, CARD domain containing 5 isoform X2 [Boleophthalmus pectinirostris]
MEEEADPDVENAKTVLDQEYSELLHILTNQASTTLEKLCAPLNSSAGPISTISPPSSPAARVKDLLDYYSTADSPLCCDFLQRICLLCENIPMWLESRLMSASGNPTNVCDISRLHVTESPEKQIIKRPRIDADSWDQFITSIKEFLRRRWKAMRKHLVMDVELDQVWVRVRRVNRARDRPDQTPGRTPDSDVECGFPESRVTLDTFLQSSMGKVTILYGPPGSGKTVLMSRLGERWACDLGHIPSSHLFVLLEFRHLNLLSQTLSFYDLLFQYYPSPQGGENEKIAIVDYLMSNPEQSCWVLDGYDEFQSDLDERGHNNAQWDPRSPRPVAELIAALLNGRILPGCTVVFTCRVREATDLERRAEKVGGLLPWNHHKIKEYVEKYFEIKAVGKHTMKLLFSNKHLVAMSSIPALCSISCICLEYLIQEIQQSVEDKADAQKHKEDLQPVPQIPSTLTTVYLTSIGTFLSHHLNQEAMSVKVRLSQRAILSLTSLVSHYKSELSELFELAWNGLETGKILFLEEEIPHRILHFSVKAGFISETDLRQNGIIVTAYCFVHITVQEFLSALKIMTTVDDKELRKRFSLKTRWPSKSGQKTVFTNSLHRFLSGLASPHCSAVLTLLTKEGHTYVQKRQETVRKLLQQMCHSQMTGPKVLELCHCVQESQDTKLSKQLLSVKPKLDLHNITLSPDDLDALAFVVNSSEEGNIALNFRACSIELEDLDLLSQCHTITNLSFHSRKYEDSFAEKLSTVLPNLTSLKKISFCDARLTATGAAHLASALPKCPCITEINLKGNNLRDDGMKHITDILPKLPQLSFVNLGQNNTSLQAAVCLTKEISSMNVRRIYIDGNNEELMVTFDPNHDRNSHKGEDSGAEISLLKQKWNKSEIQNLAQSLTEYPSISLLKLSGQWKIETLKVLVHFLPKFHITEKIILNGCCSSLEAVIVLTSFMSQCTAVSEIHIRQKSPSQAMIVFGAGSVSKSLRVNYSSFKPGDVTALCNTLIPCHAFLELDLSHSELRDDTIQNLAEVLPKMSSLNMLKLNGCIVSTTGALILVKGVTGCERVKSVELSLQNESRVIFDRTKSDQFSCRFSYFSLDGDSLGGLFEALQSGPQLSELDLSSNKLDDKVIKHFVNSLPGLKVNNYINLSNNDLKEQGMLDVSNTLTTCDNVSAVEVCLAEDPKCLIWFTQCKKKQKCLRVTGTTLTPVHQSQLVKIMSSCQLPVTLEMKNCFSHCVEEFVEMFDSSCAGCTVNIEESWIRSEEAVRLLCHCLEHNKNINSVRIHQNTLCLNLENHNNPTGNILPLLHLSMVNCGIEGRHLALMKDTLQRCVHLTELNLSQNNLGKTGAEILCSVISSLPQLASLSVDKDSYAHFAEILCKSLLQCNELQYLSLSGYVITEITAQMITKVLPHLKSINLSHCSWLNSGGVQLIRSLAHCEHLEEICLNCVQLDQESKMCLIQSLPRTQTLRRLQLSNASTSSSVFDVLAAMMDLVHLEELKMNSWKIVDNEVDLLVKLFPLWTHLQIISLSQTLSSDQSGDKLLEALKSCTHLKELQISQNHLSDCTAARMALVFPSLTHLCVIDISENNIGPKGSVDLAKAISSLKNLIKINLTSVGTSELCAVVASLVNCPLLQDVRMGWNECGDDVAQALVRVLYVCRSLEKIDLECNRVSIVGAEALLEALQFRPALEIIRLWKNRVSPADEEKLSKKDRRLNFSST